jgi:hypothetical protein
MTETLDLLYAATKLVSPGRDHLRPGPALCRSAVNPLVHT